MSNVILQVGVKVILKDQKGRLLLLRRNANKYPEVGSKWDIVGGRISPGTSLLENLKREMYEETQLELQSNPYLIAAQDIIKSDQRHIVRLTYLASVNGTPVLSDEHDQFNWFTYDELSSLPIELLDRYVKDLVDSNLLQEKLEFYSSL